MSVLPMCLNPIEVYLITYAASRLKYFVLSTTQAYIYFRARR